ncbi:MAG TPA: hypothetical protein GXZ76_00705 [Clostridiaceae bacterium]|nr:hypothetical protein [Clostridiaceae bacterium]
MFEFLFNCYIRFYSYRKASIELSRAALRAGAIPKIRPVKVEKIIAITIQRKLKTTLKFKIADAIRDNITPNSKPQNPPNIVKKVASVKN